MSDVHASTAVRSVNSKNCVDVWLFFPDYRGSMPYQTLLADALSGRVEVSPGTIGMAVDAAAKHRTVFHLHWEDALYADAGSEAEAAAVIADSLDRLAVLRMRGGLLVWTMHNAAPHEDRFPSLSLALRRGLARLADVLHVHCLTGVDLALSLGAPEERIVMVPHPDIVPAYPDDITDAAARRYFGFGPAETVFAFIGANRGDRDIGGLYESFIALNALYPDARLVMAGRIGSYFEQRFLEPEFGIRLIPRFIDDAVVQYVLRAADFAVLPYLNVLTSGALSLALGFGRPAIVPSLPALLDVVRPGKDVLVYHAGDTEDLLRVMIEAMELNGVDRGKMREQALRSGRKVDFASLADSLLSAVEH